MKGKIVFGAVLSAALVVGASIAPRTADAALDQIFGGSKVSIEVPVPAEFPQIAEHPRVLVTRFGGNDGAAFTSAVREALQRSEVDGEPVFTVLSPAMYGGSLDLSGGLPALQRLKEDGIDALYAGVASFNSDTQNYRDTQRVCVEQETGFLGMKTCKNYDPRTVNCVRNTGSYEADFRIIDTATGQELYSRLKRDSAEDSECAQDVSSMPIARSSDELADAARQGVLGQLIRDITPRPETVEVGLKKMSTRGVRDRDLRKMIGAVNEARTAAIRGNLDDACGEFSYYEESVEAFANNAALLFNLGVCAEHQNDFARAQELYDAVLANEPSDREAIQSVQRVRRTIDAIVDAQGD